MHARATTHFQPKQPEPWTSVRAALLQRKCACGGQCSDCDEKKVQRQPIGSVQSGIAPSIVREVISAPGQSLSKSTRDFFEPRFNSDFSQVRVHTDARARESAGAVNALAYTVGRDIVFNSGQFQPHTQSGRRLIAHELTHTLQQSSAASLSGSPLRISSENDPRELDADRTASRIVEKGNADHSLKVGSELVQRTPDKDKGDKSKTAKQPCPTVTPDASVEEFKRAACVRPAPAGTPAECEFTPAQMKTIKAAQNEGANRVKRARQRIGVKEGRSYASNLANKLFVTDAPSIATVEKLLGKVEPLLSGTDVSFAGRTCADETCKEPPTVAYVKAPGTLPIFICPVSFHEPDQLHRIILHEAMHWAGVVVKDPRLPEIYCEKFDCQTSCGTSEIADAWMHYINCLGEPLTAKKSFIPEMIKSVEEID